MLWQESDVFPAPGGALLNTRGASMVLKLMALQSSLQSPPTTARIEFCCYQVIVAFRKV